MPESYPNHTSNFPLLNVGPLPEQNFCFVSTIFFFATTGHGLCAVLLLRKIRQQRQPAAAPCNGINMPTPKRTRTPLSLQHPKAAPCSGTSGPAPECTGHSCSSTLQQQRAAAPYTSTLAAPSSTTLAPPPAASSTAPSSITLRQHLQHCSAAAPTCPLQTAHTTVTANNTLHQHLAAALQRRQHARSKLQTPF